VTADCLKLTIYFGESDRRGGQLLSDALLDLFEQHGVHAAVLMRAVEGFGLEHTLRTDRFLTLSEDLPLVAVAVDERARIEALLPHVVDLVGGGLVTLERARLLQDRLDSVELPQELHEATKLTLYLGRDERVRGRPAFLDVVGRLHAQGLAGATVLLGVDGMAHRQRRRARFFAYNDAVPVMIVSIGAGEAVAQALRVLDEFLADPIVTLERVRVCKRDGRLLADPLHLPEQDDAGLRVWQKLMVYASEQARHGDHPLYVELIRRLRADGASGATSLRGIWGFSGDHPPHGDRLFHVRRRVPVVTTLVDTPDRIQRSFRIVDEVTDRVGLVTSELVPALHAVAPD
jgi:PII-like signaling protein